MRYLDTSSCFKVHTVTLFRRTVWQRSTGPSDQLPTGLTHSRIPRLPGVIMCHSTCDIVFGREQICRNGFYCLFGQESVRSSLYIFLVVLLILYQFRFRSQFCICSHMIGKMKYETRMVQTHPKTDKLLNYCTLLQQSRGLEPFASVAGKDQSGQDVVIFEFGSPEAAPADNEFVGSKWWFARNMGIDFAWSQRSSCQITSRFRLLQVENLHLISPQLDTFLSFRVKLSGIHQKNDRNSPQAPGSFLACYCQGSVRNPGSRGSLHFRVVLSADGEVWYSFREVGRGLVTGCLDRYEHDERIYCKHANYYTNSTSCQYMLVVCMRLLTTMCRSLMYKLITPHFYLHMDRHNV